jgi:alkanesulfonate monooxygenase SsuD/methylene tetrahydromethanopterin reductase-like flavin-dependent oxidoreductase (luciferase family)
MTIAFGLFDNLQIDPSDPRPAGEVLEQRLADIAYAESIGMWGYFTAERHFWSAYRSVAPSVWIAAASQRTKTIRLGVMAYTLPLHAPAQLAEEIAMLDTISGGRFELGVGLGHRPIELDQVGVDPATRIPRFQEEIVILQGLLTGGAASITSDFHTLKDVSLGVLPVQDPYPPIWYAGTDLNAGAWAGANGHNLAVGFAPVKALLPVVATYRAARAEVATQPDSAHLANGGKVALMRHLYIGESDESARNEMIEDLYRLNGLDPKVKDGSRANRREDSAAEVDRLLEQEIFIAGGPESVAQSLRFAHQALGYDCFLANVYGAGIEQERARRSMRLLVEVVAPRLEAAALTRS